MQNKATTLSVLILCFVAALAFLYQPATTQAPLTTPKETILTAQPTQTNTPPSSITSPEISIIPVTNIHESISQELPPTTDTQPQQVTQHTPPPSIPAQVVEEIHLQVLNSGPTNSKQIAITFDDGPHPTITPKILEILRERDVKATFFVLGDRVKHYPWILQQMVAEGHEIGNHTYTHGLLTAMTSDLIEREITKTQTEIKNITGYEPRLFRPPYGAFRPETKEIFRDHHFAVILWSVDTLDWKVRNQEKIFNTITNQTRNGSIILCHDIQKATMEALPNILDHLKSEGYEFTTVNHLCGLPSMTDEIKTLATSQTSIKPVEEHFHHAGN